ncbi:hypothetical protein [Streptomyces kebangsaanensis]|uniref:hypothetical protein n=1 Tax=Streptomyces kebangsaanensis TaxID=864058 RepID=UPI0009391497|nr:hypothetical protein [Streptomyces kebangsaanensis]
MTPKQILTLFAANLGEAEDSTVRIVGNSLYVRYANDPAVLKITCEMGNATGERDITFQLIHPEHGPIDTAGFTLTRSQEFTAALEQLDAFQDIWF